MATFRAKVMRYFNGRTPIDGFAFINDSKKTWQALFWYILLFALFILTTIDLYRLTMRFKANPTVTNIELVTKDEFLLPRLGLCLDLSLEHLVNLSSVDWNQTAEEISGLLHNLKSSNSSLLEPWPELPYRRQLTLVVALFFENLHQLENAPMMVDYKFYPFSWMPYSGRKLENDGEWITSIIQMIYDDLRNRNLHKDLSLLSKQLGVSLYKYADIQIQANMYVNNHDAVPMDIISSEPTIWFEQDRLHHQLCFSILDLPSGFSFGTPNDYMRITVDYSSLYPSMYATLDAAANFPRGFTTKTSLSLNNAYQVVKHQPHGDHTVYSHAGSETEITIELLSEYRSLAAKSGCSTSETLPQCRSRCQAELITGPCPQCTPYSWTNLFDNPKDLSHCSLYDYNTCLVYDGGTGAGECERACRSACHIKLYKMKTYNTVAKDILKPGKAGFLLKPILYPYPVFIEEELLTWSSFMSELGGVASLWLGASFIALIHFFWFLIFELPILISQAVKGTPVEIGLE